MQYDYTWRSKAGSVPCSTPCHITAGSGHVRIRVQDPHAPGQIELNVPADQVTLRPSAMGPEFCTSDELFSCGTQRSVDGAFETAMTGCTYGAEETRDARHWFTEGFNAGRAQ